MDLGTYLKVECTDYILIVEDIDLKFLTFQFFKVCALKQLQILGIYLFFKDKQLTIINIIDIQVDNKKDLKLKDYEFSYEIITNHSSLTFFYINYTWIKE